MIDVTVRCLLRDRRRDRRISQRDLENVSGISRSRISKYESGEIAMTVETAVRFAIILNCTLDELFDYKRRP